MNDRKFALEAETLLHDSGISINHFALHMTTSFMASQIGLNPNTFVIRYLNVYKVIEDIMKKIPNYYQAGFEIESTSKKF